ncbi:hypothetical protein TVAG_008760 [Trichomonas vaginalis G3]|uniref:Uncharacterized protein n=1 Tax=Trichomonas vaginalis (strain ATCC PRA-98 / G3) TaxID=412133 RepID=A2F7U8_TRIV3|nr:hypothetical protein TVAGG3_0018100 [Trichomonas vaginalis G3]EAX99027.1 hypothetical protein TVAG_008760 [Trichomonas vaginalis G3]KAI5539501.1 hypothetical protein TVAGG3_0018100 [Trichomonas vaginalis G3]|eukprot:XP_001311957.1 hypothetical protein [Trichomonas vaginalis G3]
MISLFFYHILSENCYDFSSPILDQLIFSDESIYSCYIIHDCTAINLKLQKDGGRIRISKSNNKLQLNNVLFSGCSSSTAAVALVDNSMSVNTQNLCVYNCKSNEISFGRFSGEAEFTLCTTALLSGIDAGKDNNVLEFNCVGIVLNNNNFTSNIGKNIVNMQAKTTSSVIYLNFASNSIKNDLTGAGFEIGSKGNAKFSNFIRNILSYSLGTSGSNTTIESSYFISNYKDIKSKSNLYLVHCFTDQRISISGLVYAANISYEPYPRNNIYYSNGICRTTQYPKFIIPTPAPTLPEKCEDPPNEEKLHARRYKYVFCLAEFSSL